MLFQSNGDPNEFHGPFDTEQLKHLSAPDLDGARRQVYRCGNIFGGFAFGVQTAGALVDDIQRLKNVEQLHQRLFAVVVRSAEANDGTCDAENEVVGVPQFTELAFEGPEVVSLARRVSTFVFAVEGTNAFSDQFVRVLCELGRSVQSSHVSVFSSDGCDPRKEQLMCGIVVNDRTLVVLDRYTGFDLG